MMKVRIVLLFLVATLLLCGTAIAQPWAKKAAPAVFTLKTFGADGSLVGSANGFFVGSGGEAVSCFTPFRGAQRAVVIDAQGKEWPVDCIVGADDTYDVAKFQVSVKKSAALPLAADAAEGASVWLLPYSVKKAPACAEGKITKCETFQQLYAYCTLDLTSTSMQAGCPVLTADGQVVGLLQPATADLPSTSYAVSARFATDMQFNSFSVNSAALRSTGIAKALPEDHDQALVALFLAHSSMDSLQYSQYVDRFIGQFPQSADGYTTRARLLVGGGRFAEADADLQQALKQAEKKDEVHQQYAALMYAKCLYQADLPYPDWTLDRALEEARAAYAFNPMPAYKELQAQILYAQQKYADSYSLYNELTQTSLRSADIFHAAAQCKLMLDEKREALALLDSAVAMFSRPYVKTVVPYLHSRAQMAMECKRYQQAILDMQDVVALEPVNPILWAEKASYEVRVRLTDQAMKSARQCISLAPDMSDGYLFLGLAQCLAEQKADGLANLQKAKELGNDQAQGLIDKYGK